MWLVHNTHQKHQKCSDSVWTEITPNFMIHYIEFIGPECCYYHAFFWEMQKAKLNCKQINWQCGLNEAVIRHRLCEWRNSQHAIMLYHREDFASIIFISIVFVFYMSFFYSGTCTKWAQATPFERAKAVYFGVSYKPDFICKWGYHLKWENSHKQKKFIPFT